VAPACFARVQKSAPGPLCPTVEGLAELAGVTEACADVFGEDEFVDPDRPFVCEAAAPAVFVSDPADEFALPAAVDPVEFEFGAVLAPVFVLPFLLVAADEFELP